jgi:hypothetical protein
VAYGHLAPSLEHIRAHPLWKDQPLTIAYDYLHAAYRVTHAPSGANVEVTQDALSRAYQHGEDPLVTLHRCVAQALVEYRSKKLSAGA